jgi:hypothetical protein
MKKNLLIVLVGSAILVFLWASQFVYTQASNLYSLQTPSILQDLARQIQAIRDQIQLLIKQIQIKQQISPSTTSTSSATSTVTTPAVSTFSPPTTSTTATPPLPDKDTYYISSKEPGPQIYEASFDPLGSVAPGVEQFIRVKVRYEKPVESVGVKMIMDNGEHTVPLSLNEGSAADGIWGGSWKVADTHKKIYQAAIEATSGKMKSRVVLTFQPAH